MVNDALRLKPQFGYNVKIDSYCDYSEREDVEYGDWSESYTNSFDGVVKKTDQYPDVTSIFDIQPGTKVWVAWAEWSSGDSFGRADNGYTEVLGIFLDKYAAEELRTHIINGGNQGEADRQNPGKRKKKVKNPEGYGIRTSDGQWFESGFAPWSGYFERLTDIHIESATVEV